MASALRTPLSRHRKNRATRSAIVAGALAAATALTTMPVATADTTAVYDQQLAHTNGIFRIVAPLTAGAQEFTTDVTEVGHVAAYVVNEAAHGTIRAEIRTSVTDPGSAIGTSEVSVEDLGGWGRGWIDFAFPDPVAVEPGTTYYLVVQAHHVDGNVVWNGRRAAIDEALPSWGYDVNYWGGWQRYDGRTNFSTTRLAFAVEPDESSQCQSLGTCYAATPRPAATLHWDGLLGNDNHVVGVDAKEAEGASFVPYSDVLRLANGRLRYLPEGRAEPVTVLADDSGALAKIEADRRWLESGTVPGRTEHERQIAARALLDMRLLLQPNGSLAAAWWSIWAYSWPRDGSFVAAALAHTGHPEEALSILRFFADAQGENGTWEARYHLDGKPVMDGRHWQIDGNGWVPWAVWQWHEAAPPRQRQKVLGQLWPMVRKSADYAAGSLQENGLPEVTPDYWENAVDQATIANSAALLSGLRASADIAIALGHRDKARDWIAAVERLQAAIGAEFAPYGYPRTPNPDAGADSLVTVMMPPFVPETAPVRKAVLDAAEALTLPNGGVLPGEDWRGNPFDAWTPETAMFALQAAATGRESEADRWLDWLYAHRTSLGSLPEKVRADGQPLSVAPLAWTAGIVTLSLVALEDGLPTPADPCSDPARSVLCR